MSMKRLPLVSPLVARSRSPKGYANIRLAVLSFPEKVSVQLRLVLRSHVRCKASTYASDDPTGAGTLLPVLGFHRSSEGDGSARPREAGAAAHAPLRDAGRGALHPREVRPPAGG